MVQASESVDAGIHTRVVAVVGLPLTQSVPRPAAGVRGSASRGRVPLVVLREW